MPKKGFIARGVGGAGFNLRGSLEPLGQFATEVKEG
jgi:hypothetical protein